MDKQPFITVTQGMRGWFAVKLWWNPDGFWEPWSTSEDTFIDAKAAEPDGIAWAEAEGLEFRPYTPAPPLF